MKQLLSLSSLLFSNSKVCLSDWPDNWYDRFFQRVSRRQTKPVSNGHDADRLQIFWRRTIFTCIYYYYYTFVFYIWWFLFCIYFFFLFFIFLRSGSSFWQIIATDQINLANELVLKKKTMLLFSLIQLVYGQIIDIDRVTGVFLISV